MIFSAAKIHKIHERPRARRTPPTALRPQEPDLEGLGTSDGGRLANLQRAADLSPQAAKLQAIQRMVDQVSVSSRGVVTQLQRDLDLSGIPVRILDSAARHMTENEVYNTLQADEVTGEILQASMNGTLSTWNAKKLEADNGYCVLCTWRNNRLEVYHSDKGDKYKEENRKITQDRFDKASGGSGGSMGPKSNVYDPTQIPEGYDY